MRSHIRTFGGFGVYRLAWKQGICIYGSAGLVVSADNVVSACTQLLTSLIYDEYFKQRAAPTCITPVLSDYLSHPRYGTKPRWTQRAP
jgi:hypothetical protein